MFHGKQVLFAALVVLATGSPLPGAQTEAVETAVVWKDAPQYVHLFAPARAHREAYRAYTSPLDLQAILRTLASDPALIRPPGAWAPAALLPQDAFGQTGNYQSWKLARLFGARRTMVVRGPRNTGAGPGEAWTLISPYPDSEFEHLEPGTLLIVLDLAR